jgi:thiazole synthase
LAQVNIKICSECAKAIKLSGAEIVTVAVRRVNITDKRKPLLMDYIDPKKSHICQIQQGV